jgi:gluconate 2-dehydrogenase subunit 3-like protein
MDKETGQPMPPRATPGYYPEFNTLSQQAFWDEATRNVVLNRVQHTPPIRFFSADEARLMAALCDRLLPQDDRDAGHKIPIVNVIDERLFTGRIDGYRYEDMPPDDETWRIVARELDRTAGGDFAAVDDTRRQEIVSAFAQGELDWELNVSRAWSVVMRAALAAFYSHPWAFNEIGFGGPAYPRGYMRLQPGRPGREPYEAVEAYDVDPVEEAP